jgi:hypothetical protein
MCGLIFFLAKIKNYIFSLSFKNNAASQIISALVLNIGCNFNEPMETFDFWNVLFPLNLSYFLSLEIFFWSPDSAVSPLSGFVDLTSKMTDPFLISVRTLLKHNVTFHYFKHKNDLIQKIERNLFLFLIECFFRLLIPNPLLDIRNLG